MAKKSQPSPVTDSEIIRRYQDINQGIKDTGSSMDISRLSKEGQKLAKQGANRGAGRDPKSLGQYAEFPGSTPKYMRHNSAGTLRRENFETLARMHVRMGSAKDRERIIKKLDTAGSKEIGERLIGSSQTSLGYVDFFLTHATMPTAEKYQVSELLADNYVAFFYGQQAPIFSFTGYLMNSWQDDWMIQMFRAYRDILRGSQLAKNGLKLFIRYNSMIVSGQLLNMQMDLDSANEMVVPFNTSLLVKKVHILHEGLTGPTAIPEGGATFFPTDYLNSDKEEPGKKTQANDPEAQVSAKADPKTPEGTTEAKAEVPVEDKKKDDVVPADADKRDYGDGTFGMGDATDEESAKAAEELF